MRDMRLLTLIARREVLYGALAGLAAGVVFALAMQAEQMRVEITGLAGVSTTGAGLILHLVLAAVIGAAVGTQYRHEPGSYAAQITLGVTFGLLGWIAGPLTIRPLAEGHVPDWSIAVASAGFPSLMGHMLYGALTIGGLYWAVDRWGGGRMLARTGERAEGRVQRIVVLGGGFGGMSAAQTLERITRKRRDLEVTLVSQSNFLLFTPMLAEVASSALEAQHIAAPIRAACPFTSFIHGDVQQIDTEKRQVLVQSRRSAVPQRVSYDHLVLAMGSVPNFYGLPGLAEHAITLKTLEDAVGLRHRVLSQLERADHESDVNVRQRLLTFVVAGGGFAGAETIAELYDLVSSVRRYYQNLRPGDARFVLVHSRDRILPELSAELGAYALEKLSARGIEFRLGRRVAAAAKGSVTLDDGTLIACEAFVWTAGNQPNPLLATMGAEKNRAGQVVVDATLQSPDTPGIWAVGDGAQVPDLTNEGRPCPPTAQHALRQGKRVALNILATIDGRTPKPFRYRATGSLVGLGHRTAAAEIRGLKFSGLLAWFMWRTIYLSKLPGLERKARVALDWALDLVFPRDIVLTAAADGRFGSDDPERER
jgi:NADH dehydrogenase